MELLCHAIITWLCFYFPPSDLSEIDLDLPATDLIGFQKYIYQGNPSICLFRRSGMPLYIRLDIFVSNGTFNISIYPTLIEIYPIPCFSNIHFSAYYDQVHCDIPKLRSIFSIDIPNLADLAVFWKLDFNVEELIFLKLHRSSIIKDMISDFDRN